MQKSGEDGEREEREGEKNSNLKWSGVVFSFPSSASRIYTYLYTEWNAYSHKYLRLAS